MNIFIYLDSGNEEDTLEPVSRELPEELAYGSEGQSSDSDGLVMSSASVHGAGIPQVDHSCRPRRGIKISSHRECWQTDCDGKDN